MKFGQQLKDSLIRDYYYYYIDYQGLKDLLNVASEEEQWSEDLEESFVKALEEELEKVYDFQKLRTYSINQRVKEMDVKVQDAIRSIDTTSPLSEQAFEDLELDLEEILSDVHDLAKFTQLNYTGFQKIIKKHDKVTHWILKPIFAARLNAKPFFRDDYDPLVMKLSQLYDLVRTRGNPVQGDSAAGGSQQNFVRQTTKYWVHPDNITEVKLLILKHLPVLVFNASKEFEKEDSAISSIYYDNSSLYLYKGRLEKSEGAEAIRLRWYGGMNSDLIFVERKTHREDWTGEKSVKARFSLKEKNVNAFLSGEYTVEQAFKKMREDGKKSPKEIEDLEQLAREVQYTVITKKLKPMVRSFYNRTAFQLPGDARVRISLDTELSMVREDDLDGRKRAGNNWRRMDIGVDFPFNQLPDRDVERFPYAVLEVKLQTQHGQEPPQWVRDLVASHLVEAVPKFSKFIHGTATLLPERVTLIPYWLPQMDVDIRKPVTHQFGIERPNNMASISSLSNSDDILSIGEMDEEQALDAHAQNSTATSHSDVSSSTTTTASATSSRHMEEHDYIFDEDEEDEGAEHIPLLGMSSNGRARSNRTQQFHDFNETIKQIGQTLRSWSDSIIFEPSQSNNAPAAANAPVVEERVFKAPPGKLIHIPVRIEPKVYFANERTFLNWLEIGIYMSAMSGSLRAFGNERAERASFCFMLTAVVIIVYSLGLYLWRARAIRLRRAIRYDDQFGTGLVCFAFVMSILVNYVIQVL
ncbi:VTC domain-containing protein [Lipomyces oligophaga]|uniref:VTC domain-containing protein n=1 Tax=Lipomyces oligophaga TaxID=45792 RepID=UPI0034CE6C21